MASLAEHLSGPPVEAAPVAITANLAPIALFCVTLTLFVVSCSAIASYRFMPARR